MPVYVYECDSCHVRFERLQKPDDPPMKTCPKCRRRVRKVFFPVGIVFRGPGFHVTDYGRGNGRSHQSSQPKEPAAPADKGDSASKDKDEG